MKDKETEYSRHAFGTNWDRWVCEGIRVIGPCKIFISSLKEILSTPVSRNIFQGMLLYKQFNLIVLNS